MKPSNAIRLTAVIAMLILGMAVFRFAANQSAKVVAADKPITPPPVQAVGHPSMESPQFNPIAVSGGRVFVANTPAGTVDVIDTKSRKVVTRIPVGVDPVCIAVRPDGKEVWVANHVSDSVSVIDTDHASPTFLHVIATVQEFDPKTRATKFDEPAGIAFASNEKAYVSLSSENQIAVIDVAARKVTKRLTIPAQEPRAIAVRNGKLHVVPFESGNKTQLSGGTKDKIDGDLVTFDAYNHSIQNNNVLSIGHVVDIVKHPKVPDRDLFVFDTANDKLVATVDGLGTLLYGLAVDSKGTAFVAQTDARNEVNGRSGTKKHGLKEMENRAFLNRITRLADGKAEKPTFFDLEPLPPKQPEKGQALATPFAIQVSDDDSTLIATAASSDKLFTVDAKTGDVLGRVEVGAGPRGVALDGTNVWVLNALDNTVTLVDLSDKAKPKSVSTIVLEDPTHPVFKRGRIAFNTAKASTTGTFSCASCHPDGHTDQLLWVLDTPIVTGGNHIMPRSTMPVRGLRDTEPYHWDGIPGDPYGGIHSASTRKSVEPNSKKGVPTSSTRHLIDGGLASTMHLVGDTAKNDEGKAGELSAKERDDMAVYLLGVPYPPAPKRAYTNELSDRAKSGFRLFHVEGDHDPKQLAPNVCGNCHRMPFLVSTNTPGTGMDAPTWRGAQDRWLILPQGRLNIIEFPFYRAMAEQSAPERDVWRMSWGGRPRFDPIWDMVLEMGTGLSGAFARQAPLNKTTASDALTADLLNALERAATDEAVVLECDGVLLQPKVEPVALQFLAGKYVGKTADRSAFTRKELLALAADGKFVGTVTARHGAKATVDHPQPALWTLGPIERQRGRQDFPVLHTEQKSMTVSGRHFGDDARIFVNGRQVDGSVSVKKDEKDEKVVITLATLPPVGTHFLQVQVPEGLFSNEFIIHVAKDADTAAALQRELIRTSTAPWGGIPAALNSGDLAGVKRLIRDKATANRRLSDGSMPLSSAAVRGHLEVVRHLLELGADPSGSNDDGNTPLHAAAFLCREEVVKLLLDKGSSLTAKNNNGETPIDVVSGEWSQGLSDFYTAIGTGINQKLDLKQIEKDRPKMARLLRAQGEKLKGDAAPKGDGLPDEKPDDKPKTEKPVAVKVPDDVAFRTADITSEGTRMAAEVFAPKKPKTDKLPTIVMSHGWGGTVESLRPDAIKFAQAGYLVVVFDYRGWGNSDSRLVAVGKPERKDGKLIAEVKEVREVVDPIDQTTDILNAISWTAGDKQCDPNRIGIWGSSFSGGHVVYVAARDPRVKAFVSQVGSMDGRWVLGPTLRKYTFDQAAARTRGEIGYPKPLEKFGTLTGAPVIEKFVGYAPIEDIGRCKDCAKLFIIAEKEELFDNKDHAILAHERATGVKKLVNIKGIKHYGIYNEARDQAQKEAIAWFDEHLKPAASTKDGK
jgi:YVTN family beta-propeller protein